jgi:hypothetical protein
MHDFGPQPPQAGRARACRAIGGGRRLALAFLMLIWQPARAIAAGPVSGSASANPPNTRPFAAIQRSTQLSWSLSARKIGLGIILGESQGKREIRLGICQLVEQTSKEPLDCSHFQLCLEAGGTCGRSLSLAGNANPVYIKIDDDFHPVGNYRGPVQLMAQDTADIGTIAIDLYGTTGGRAALGVVAIALGVALAWAISVFVRARIDRDQALLPATQLRTSLDKLLDVLGQVQPQWSGNVAATAAAVHKLQDSLTEESLDLQGLLPPQVPSPYPTTYSGTAYTQYLLAATEHANMLGVIVNQGMAQAWGMYRIGMTPVQKQAIATALDGLDALDATISPPSQAQAQPRVDAILTTLKQALGFAPAALAPAGAPPAPQPPTTKALRFQIAWLTWIVWGALFVITVVTGYAALIQSKAGFGLARDYLVCFLWGLGLPVGGLQLSALVPSSVSTALHLPILK